MFHKKLIGAITDKAFGGFIYVFLCTYLFVFMLIHFLFPFQGHYSYSRMTL